MFTKDNASEYGKRSKRGKDSNAEILRKHMVDNLDIDVLFSEINDLKLRDRVNAKIKLLAFLLPKLNAVDVTMDDVTVANFLTMDNKDQDQYLKTLGDGRN